MQIHTNLVLIVIVIKNNSFVLFTCKQSNQFSVDSAPHLKNNRKSTQFWNINLDLLFVFVLTLPKDTVKR